jgi:hypothetical protein
MVAYQAMACPWLALLAEQPSDYLDRMEASQEVDSAFEVSWERPAVPWEDDSYAEAEFAWHLYHCPGCHIGHHVPYYHLFVAV